MQIAPFTVCRCPACNHDDLWHILIWLWKTGSVLIRYWATQAWLNVFVAGFTDQWTMWLHHNACPGIAWKRCSVFLSYHIMVNTWYQMLWMWTCADVAKLLIEDDNLSWKVHITPCPNISVDRQKVDVVYYWTRWCIDLWCSGPVFGGLAMLFSSLSFPQHLYRWLQLLTDHWSNRLVSDREKARLCPQNIISCLWEVWALLIKQLGRAAQIDCQDAVMSDWPGWREKLNPFMALFFPPRSDILAHEIRHIITSLNF